MSGLVGWPTNPNAGGQCGLTHRNSTMCGIAGIITNGQVGAADKVAVLAMNQSLQRRGPDGEGTYFRENVGLAMRRLSIIDLAGGWQPLYNEDQSVALVANGEIYNYIELREHLASRGHSFRTKSDCELPAHLYEEYGLDFVHHMRGMFAFALWDTAKKRLVLVRDRMGEKPLFIHQHTGQDGSKQILFASEMKSLLSSGLVPFELEPTSVDEMMHYNWVHDPKTMVKGVRKLEAGHMLVIDTDPWNVKDICYWRMEDAPPIEADPAKTIRAVLDDVSKLIIRSDVPVGVTLSGGIDSSTIACLSATKYPGQMHAFSVGYAGKPVQDERDLARSLAKRLHMPFHEAEIHPEEMAAFFPQVCLLQDDPIADIGGYAYYVINKLAREHNVPVLLMGQGGDELFWGYPWLRRALNESQYKAAHGRTRRTPLRELLLPQNTNRSSLIELAFRMGGALHGWRPLSLPFNNDPDRLVFYDIFDSWQMGEWGRNHLYTDEFRTKLSGFDAAWPHILPGNKQSVEVTLTALMCKGYLLEQGLNQGDRLSMAHSVECRLPLIDYKLVEAVVGLRKVHKGDEHLGLKAWLRMAVEDIVPSEIFTRPKRGLNPPVTLWTQSLRDLYGADLRNGYLVENGVLSHQAAARLTEPTSRLTAWNDLFFKALTLEMWARSMDEIATQAARVQAAAHSRVA
ncbi:MAG: asparagine synthase (glutamine-hydrolyzing) [Phycisphaerales bacterium]|nr:asparagine synthase (glutamine-hydrolyzing) [Phycisphaerales bacterium]